MGSIVRSQHGKFMPALFANSLCSLRISCGLTALVHEGEPVYLKPHHVLLKPVQAALTQGAWSRDCEDPSWVIVLKERGRMGLGFRVHKIAGPFHVAMNEGANSVHYGGLDYSIVKVLTN